jgi:hypothetical protein
MNRRCTLICIVQLRFLVDGTTFINKKTPNKVGVEFLPVDLIGFRRGLDIGLFFLGVGFFLVCCRIWIF